MEQTVYADLLFLINFSMDFLCLFSVAKLLSRPFSFIRGAAAASLGGMYSVLSLFLNLPTPAAVAIDVAACILLCVTVFCKKGETFTSLLLLSSAFFLSSMLLGGIMTAIFNLLNRLSPPTDQFSDGEGIPLWILAPVTALSAFITWIGGRFLRKRAQTVSAVVEIRLGKKTAIIRGMCDSGNLLRDAISGKSIIVSDKRNAKNLLPVDCPPIDQWTVESIDELPPSVRSRLRLIPAGTANGEGLMMALRPDAVILRTSNGTRTADALIGFADVHCALHDCTALIPPEFIT